MRSSTHEFDLVVRGGLVVDGSGGPARRADVAVLGDRIAEVGAVKARGNEEIDATGLVVAPGFVDPHAHMDAQVFWDDLGKPTCWHGVTSVVMGNCGFTLAPAHLDEKALVVRNLERAEDIAAEAMEHGLPWNWETFSEYLDAIDARAKGVNYAACIGHSALRTWAMGERAFDHDATPEDLAIMAAELRSALQAGAAGFTTSRSGHVASDGRPVASRRAQWDELRALVEIVDRESTAVFQLAPGGSHDPEIRRQKEDALQALAISIRVPVVFGMFANAKMPLPSARFMDETVAKGGDIYGLTHCRGVSAGQSFLTRLGFDSLPEWQDVRRRPLEEQKALLRDPQIRSTLVHAAHHGDYGAAFGAEAAQPKYDTMRILLSVYPPNPTVSDEARRRGVDPVEAMIDIALEHDFDVFFMQELVHQEDDDLVALLRHPRTAMGFSDSGAHVSQVFDSSIFSHLLGYWVRQRQVFTLEEAVKMITSRPAAIWRLRDRGSLAPGSMADLTIFDPETVGPLMPNVVHDIPGNAIRVEQKSEGFAATIVNGEILLRDGHETGNRPGRLLRAGSATS